MLQHWDSFHTRSDSQAPGDGDTGKKTDTKGRGAVHNRLRNGEIAWPQICL